MLTCVRRRCHSIAQSHSLKYRDAAFWRPNCEQYHIIHQVEGRAVTRLDKVKTEMQHFSVRTANDITIFPQIKTRCHSIRRGQSLKYRDAAFRRPNCERYHIVPPGKLCRPATQLRKVRVSKTETQHFGVQTANDIT